jgi:DNA-binding IclR family transcriptional regulator
MAEEPPHSTFHLALREGARHPLAVGADGIAILAGRPASDSDTEEVRAARRRGYAVTIGALQEGAVGVAAPVRLSDWATASIGVVQLGVRVSNERIPAAVMEAAAQAGARLSGSAGIADLALGYAEGWFLPVLCPARRKLRAGAGRFSGQRSA